MIYTDSGKYAIRAVTYLAGCTPEELPVSAADVAEAEDIPPYYLAKVLQDLAREGLLDSVRGRGGGFLLDREPDKISVLDVLKAVENISRLEKECVLGLDDCSDQAPCPLHNMWKNYRESLVAKLSEMTVADLVVELERKRRALGTTRGKAVAAETGILSDDGTTATTPGG